MATLLHLANDDSTHSLRPHNQNILMNERHLRNKIEVMHSVIHEIFAVFLRPEFDNSHIAHDDAFNDLTETVQ